MVLTSQEPTHEVLSVDPLDLTDQRHVAYATARVALRVIEEYYKEDECTRLLVAVPIGGRLQEGFAPCLREYLTE